jgi:hypothetical protein
VQVVALLAPATQFLDAVFLNGDLVEHAVGVGDAGEGVGVAGDVKGFGQGPITPLDAGQEAARLDRNWDMTHGQIVSEGVDFRFGVGYRIRPMNPRRRRTHFGLAAALVLAAVAAVGCDSGKTETGYTPHRLNMGSSDIRALYAPAFSPEAHSTDDKKVESQFRKPTY